ncbi:type VI secretion system Vgr family protein [Halomonas sp. 328]|uniref:type VI secretion system Vgr family protein n=1 Tax=Halomonas sp. 328 TaxID=2776704 RepID=UPI0018A79341|nr:type VI secretion system tip protein TssI/VgrG [Halomonas sp. 328]MBF8224205.1 type VI secretion system tip protein VgrG [Halomonas sp. 328]
MSNPTGRQFTLSLAGADEAELAVVDFSHEERLSCPFQLRVHFASPTMALVPGDLLDRPATLTVWLDGRIQRRFHGIIAELGCGERIRRRRCYEVVIRPALWRLGLRQNSRIFQQQSPLAIIKRLCEEHGLGEPSFVVAREPAEREFCVQYRETDLDFLERLAAEEGFFYFHEFEDGDLAGHRLIFADSPQALIRRGEVISHLGDPNGQNRGIRILSQESRIRPRRVTLKDYSFKQPDYAHEHSMEAGESEVVPSRDYEWFDYPGRYKADISGKKFTQIRLEHLRKDALTAKGVSELPDMQPGWKFELTGHEVVSLNGEWQVVSVHHLGEQHQALEEEAVPAEAMTRYHNEIIIVPANTAWRPEPNPKPCVDGPQIATVVGPEGEEIYCDEFGRVKVQFPWDRYGSHDEKSSCWVRVTQSSAGGAWGATNIPRVGNEVLVDFLEGDPDQPIINGRTYHAKNKPSYELPRANTKTVMRTKTHKGEGFNEISFEDEAGREELLIKACRNKRERVPKGAVSVVGFDHDEKLHAMSAVAVLFSGICPVLATSMVVAEDIVNSDLE